MSSGPKEKDYWGNYLPHTITLTRTDNTEVKVDPEPLLSCVRGSRVVIRDVKEIKAEVGYLDSWMWSTFNLLSSAGAVIQDTSRSVDRRGRLGMLARRGEWGVASSLPARSGARALVP